MGSRTPLARRAILFHLEEKLEAELAASLNAASFEVHRHESASPAVSGDLVFCTTGPALHMAQALFPHLPVIVVSRLPETAEWLDALEAGAADYCAPPFEVVHLRWLIETHAGETRRSVAASQGPSAAFAAA